MLTSTYFAFFDERPGLDERPFCKVKNYMGIPALIQLIMVCSTLTEKMSEFKTKLIYFR